MRDLTYPSQISENWGKKDEEKVTYPTFEKPRSPEHSYITEKDNNYLRET